MTVRFDGAISGFDYTNIIEQLLSIQRKPIDNLKSKIAQQTERKTSLLDISASLLSLKTTADTLARPSFFSRTKVKSSNESTLLASGDYVSGKGAFTLTANRLAGSHQAVSTGVASSTASLKPTGPSGKLRLETGAGFLDRTHLLRDLNGGLGVDRGKIKITDRLNASATIDLTDAVSLQDAVDRINGQTTAKVTASIANDRLVLTDNNSTAGAGTLKVENVGTDTTATDLGIAGSRTAGAGAVLSFFGGTINRLTPSTSLSTLNDGLGVRRSGAGASDFTVTRTNGTSFSVDLDDTDLTLQNVIDKINSAGGGTVVASIGPEGYGLQLSDSSGGGGVLAVAADAGSNAAFDLGLRVTSEKKGNVGASGSNYLHGARLIAGLNSVLRRTLNGGSSEYDSQGTLISDFTGVRDGDATITDRSGASATLKLNTRSYRTLDSSAGAGSIQINLNNLDGIAAGNQVRLVDKGSGASEVRTVARIVNAGTGLIELDQATTFALGSGDFAIAENDSLSDLQNQFRGANGVKVDVIADAQGTGLQLIDLSGASTSVLRLTDATGANAAADLGLRTEFSGTPDSYTSTQLVDDALVGLADDYLNGATLTLTVGGSSVSRTVSDFDGATGTITFSSSVGGGAVTAYTASGVNAATYRGRDLDTQYLGEQTLLSRLNQNGGVAKGKIQITDTTGKNFTVDLSQDTDDTVIDVLRDINGAAGASSSGVRARINATGDGIELIDTTPGAGVLRVAEVNSGTTARDLGILGSAAATDPAKIDGSFERTFDIRATTTLSSLVDSINAAGLNVTASIINDGSGTTPYRLSLVSKKSGEIGRLGVNVDIPGLSFSTAVKAQDAVLLYGAETAGSDPVLLTSSDNTFTGVVPGLTVDLLTASSSPVTVTVSSDQAGLVDQVQRFVDGYNKIVDKVRDLTKYDTTTEKKGLLFGDAAVQGIERRLRSLVTRSIAGIPTSKLNTLSEVGISLGQTGKLSLDQDKLNGLLESKFEEVRDVFARQRALEATTKLADLNSGLGVADSTGNDFTIYTRSGASFAVDLAGAKDIQGVLNAINLAAGNAGKVAASIASDGKRLQLVDTTTPSGLAPFKVTAVGSSTTASELGIQIDAGTSSGTISGYERLLSNNPGAGSLFSTLLKQITDDPGGTIADRNVGIDRSVSVLEKSVERSEARLTAFEKRLVQQFTTLEKFISQQEGQRSVVSGQLANLAKAFQSSK